MRWKVWGTFAVMGVTAAIGVSFWYRPRRESAELREVKQLQAEMQQTMFAPPADAKDAPPPEQRRAKFEELREKMEALPEVDRKQAEKSMREGFTKQMEHKLTTFFALPPEEQTAALDKEIDEQEARRKAWGGGGPFGPPPGERPPGAGPPAGGSPAGGPPPTGGPPAGSPDRVAGGPGSPPATAVPGPNGAPGTTGNNGNARAGNRPFGPPNWRNMTDEDRKRMQREMLDSTTPEFRAQMGEYIKKIQTRRQERGLPNFGPPA